VPPDVPIYVAPRELLAQTVGFHFHRGIVACGRRRAGVGVRELLATIAVKEGEMERRREGETESNTMATSSLRLSVSHSLCLTLVICPDVQDPTNLGSIIRSTAAFGCSAIALGPKCADPFSRRVLRVSMGAALHLPVVESRDLGADLRELSAAGFELVAAVVDPTAEPLSAFQRGERTAILFGSEGHGLAEDWLALCHRRVTIPMQVGIDSLNVAVAAAVVLYQLTR
jgi:tRNA G18 (ribose-2'-O)-methylase SpoU